jgi:hypothetical protein
MNEQARPDTDRGIPLIALPLSQAMGYSGHLDAPLKIVKHFLPAGSTSAEHVIANSRLSHPPSGWFSLDRVHDTHIIWHAPAMSEKKAAPPRASTPAPQDEPFVPAPCDQAPDTDVITRIQSRANMPEDEAMGLAVDETHRHRARRELP